MRKILSAVLAVCMLLSVMLLTSCGETPESLINGAVLNMAQLESMEADVDMEIKMSMMGVDITMPIDMHLAMADVKSGKPVAAIDAEMSMMGETVTMNMYMDGSEWAYLTVAGVSYKAKLADAKEAFPMDTSSATDVLKELPADLLADAEIVKNEDGSKSVALVITADKFSEVYGADVMEGLTSTAGDSVTMKDVTVVITVKDGYIVEYDMAFDMDMTVEGKDVAASMDMKIHYLNAGQTVTVNPPAGYQDFPELDV